MKSVHTKKAKVKNRAGGHRGANVPTKGGRPSGPTLPQSGEGMIPANEQLLDAAAVGRRLIMSPRTVSEMAVEKLLPCYQIGSLKRFKWAHVEKHLDAHFLVPALPAVGTPAGGQTTDHGTQGQPIFNHEIPKTHETKKL